MAVLAAVLAIVSVGGQFMITEELLNQQKASDQWAYYQAKSIRRYQSEVARDLFEGMKIEQQKSAYAKNAEKYRKDGEEIQKIAQEFEHESHLHGDRALRLHLGEVFVEISIVFASMAILTKRPVFWYTCIIGGIIGAAIGASSYFVQ
jgi:Domain of unknown function (DUF4337)